MAARFPVVIPDGRVLVGGKYCEGKEAGSHAGGAQEEQTAAPNLVNQQQAQQGGRHLHHAKS